MLTCKEASQLASKSMDAKLTWHERLGLWAHISMCGLCRRYVRDMKNFRNKLRKSGKLNVAPLSESVKLSSRSRERIKQAINKAITNSSDDHD